MSSKPNVSAPTVNPLQHATGFLRLPQIIGDKHAMPPTMGLIPICKSTWWAGVKTGRYPKPVKLSPRVTVWRVEDIRALIANS